LSATNMCRVKCRQPATDSQIA